MAGCCGRLPGAGLDRPAREWGDSGRAVAPGLRDSSGRLGPRSGPARAWRPGTVPAQRPLLTRGGRWVPALGRAPCSRPTSARGAPVGWPGRGRPLPIVERTGGGEGTRARLQVRSSESSREGDPVLALGKESGSGRGAAEGRGCPAAVGRGAAIVPPEVWGKLGKKVRSVASRGGRGRAQPRRAPAGRH